MTPTFTITLPSEPRMLTVGRSFVEAVCQALRVDQQLRHALVLVAGEAISNIIRHAHRTKPRAQLELELRFHPGAVELTFLDQGEPFDFAAVPHLDPAEMRCGGRGVYLMRRLMDEIECQPRAGQEGNVLRMRKRCG